MNYILYEDLEEVLKQFKNRQDINDIYTQIEEIPKIEIGENVKKLTAVRAIRGRTIQSLFDETGVAKGTIAKYENKKEARMRADTIMLLADALGVEERCIRE